MERELNPPETYWQHTCEGCGCICDSDLCWKCREEMEAEEETTED